MSIYLILNIVPAKMSVFKMNFRNDCKLNLLDIRWNYLFVEWLLFMSIIWYFNVISIFTLRNLTIPQCRSMCVCITLEWAESAILLHTNCIEKHYGWVQKPYGAYSNIKNVQRNQWFQAQKNKNPHRKTLCTQSGMSEWNTLGYRQQMPRAPYPANHFALAAAMVILPFSLTPKLCHCIYVFLQLW